MPALTIARPTRKSDSSAKPAKAPKPSAKAQARDQRHTWSHRGVALTVGLSAALNAYANAQHATVPAAGVAIGVAIPCLVFVLSKVAGMQYRAGGVSRRLSHFTGSVGLALLGLSVWHCATSLALLTGSPVWLALPMAIAIDGGLVACELDIVLG